MGLQSGDYSLWLLHFEQPFSLYIVIESIVNIKVLFSVALNQTVFNQRCKHDNESDIWSQLSVLHRFHHCVLWIHLFLSVTVLK